MNQHTLEIAHELADHGVYGSDNRALSAEDIVSVLQAVREHDLLDELWNANLSFDSWHEPDLLDV